MMTEPGELDARVNSVTPLSSDPTRVRIRCGGAGVFVIDADELAGMHVRKGDQLDACTLDQLRGAHDRLHARICALRLLAVRPRTEHELRQRLRMKRCAQEAIDLAITRLLAAGLIDDASAAESAVRSQLARGPAGPRLLEMKLRTRGVRDQTARRVVTEALADRDLRADAERVARSHAKSVPARLDKRATERRIYGKLARRGFDPDLCREVAALISAEVASTGEPVNDA